MNDDIVARLRETFPPAPDAGPITTAQRTLIATAADEIERLQDLLFSLGAMAKPPCFVCGYKGPAYFQRGTHPCAERHHRRWAGAR